MNSWTDTNDTKERAALPTPRRSSEPHSKISRSVRHDSDESEPPQGLLRRIFSRRSRRS